MSLVHRRLIKTIATRRTIQGLTDQPILYSRVGVDVGYWGSVIPQ